MKKLLYLMIPIFGAFLTINDLWAEPGPPKCDPIITVEVEHSNPAYATTDTDSLEVASMEMSEEALIEEEEYYDSLEYLACCVQAEAGNQPIEGKRLVVAVILNRVDSSDFPDDIKSVIEQSGQFAVVRNGKINKVNPTDETIEAVRAELTERSNTEVIYFQAGGFSSCGHSWKQIGDHYFSTK